MGYKVVNISSGRVQILDSGRVTRAGGHEIVPTITRSVARLKAAGLVQVLPEGAVAVGLAETAPPTAPALAVEPAPEPKKPAPEPKAKKEAPAAAEVPEAEAVVEAKPKKQVKKRKRARDDEGHFEADDPSTPDVNEAWEEEPTNGGSSRSDESSRLMDLKYEDLKKEATDAGISGRSRKALVASLLEQRFGAE